MAESSIPDELRYAETNEWARRDGDEAIIGITDYAQDELGDVVDVDLSALSAGDVIAAGGKFGDIESVKATSELFAPVGGTIVRVNEALRDNAELVNSDPYGAGWMIVVRMSDAATLDHLMDAAQYRAFLGGAGH
ncbi:MAG: glycine cleavage system protein GcvH [Ktedonobacterales bacterium]|jgi:glycine cleavage system H protein